MPSKLFSFRLSDEAVEALQSRALPNESLNLTAQRLLTEALGLSTAVDKAVNNPVDTIVDRVVNSEEFTQKLTELTQGFNAKLSEFSEKISDLEKLSA